MSGYVYGFCIDQVQRSLLHYNAHMTGASLDYIAAIPSSSYEFPFPEERTCKRGTKHSGSCVFL
jgi:hypothetical protein